MVLTYIEMTQGDAHFGGVVCSYTWLRFHVKQKLVAFVADFTPTCAEPEAAWLHTPEATPVVSRHS